MDELEWEMGRGSRWLGRVEQGCAPRPWLPCFSLQRSTSLGSQWPINGQLPTHLVVEHRDLKSPQLDYLKRLSHTQCYSSQPSIARGTTVARRSRGVNYFFAESNMRPVCFASGKHQASSVHAFDLLTR